MEKTADIIPIKWFVLFTKPRHELKVLERLISLVSMRIRQPK